jgi:hypothetical protein
VQDVLAITVLLIALATGTATTTSTVSPYGQGGAPPSCDPTVQTCTK